MTHLLVIVVYKIRKQLNTSICTSSNRMRDHTGINVTVLCLISSFCAPRLCSRTIGSSYTWKNFVVFKYFNTQQLWTHCWLSVHIE